MSELTRNALYLALGQVVTTALAIVLSAAVGRALGASDFGLLYLLTSITTFAYVFVDWGYASYVIREVARHPERTGELTGTVLAVRLVTALLVSAPAVLTTWLLGYDARTRALTIAMIAAWIPMLLALSYSWVFRGRERMDVDAVINVTLKATLLALTLVCLALGGRLVAVIVVPAIAGTITIGLAMALYRRLRLPPLHATISTANALIREGTPMFTMSLMIAVQPYIDANMLSKLAPRVVVGWYGAAATLAGTLVAPAVILASAAYPRLSRAAGEQAEFTRIVRIALRPLFFVAALGAVGTYVFADVAVTIVYSKDQFGPVGAILQVFAPALFLVYIDILLGQAILAVGKARPFARAKFAAVLLTTSLEFFLIPACQRRFGNGGIGVMLSFGIGELVMFVAALFLIPRGTFDRNVQLDLGRAVLAGAGTLLLIRTLGSVSPFIGMPASVLAFGALSAALGLVNRGDLEILRMLSGTARRRAAGDF